MSCRSPSCRWCGDNFEYFQARTGITDVAAALSVVERKEVSVDSSAKNPAAVRSYQKRLRARKGFQALADRMLSRTTAPSGTVHALLGLGDHPHRPADWWTAAVDELDHYLEDAFPARYEDRRLGLTSRQDLGEPAVCVPSYDVLGRVTGVWAAVRAVLGSEGRSGIDWRWRGIQGLPGGVGLPFGSAATIPSWGPAGLIVQDPGAALRLHIDRLRHSATLPPVVLLPHEDAFEPHRISAALPNRSWVVLTNKDLGRPTALAFQLARNLSAGVRLLPADHSTIRWTTAAASEELVSRAAPWIDRLADLIAGYPPGDRLAAFLGEFNWGSDLEPKAVRRWPAETLEKARASLTPSARRKSVVVRKDMTVVETESGWLWEERGIPVADAVPVNVSSYRASDGSTRHKGDIRFNGAFHPFDTDRFRADPQAVIESTLLDAGVDSPPSVHPSIVGHVVEIALYFSRFLPNRQP